MASDTSRTPDPRESGVELRSLRRSMDSQRPQTTKALLSHGEAEIFDAFDHTAAR
ncbi:MAG: hypothetical protein R3B67_11650 [Phycisphaerales bacterium]